MKKRVVFTALMCLLIMFQGFVPNKSADDTKKHQKDVLDPLN